MSATLDQKRWWLLQICADSFSLHFLFHFVRFTLLSRREIIFWTFRRVNWSEFSKKTSAIVSVNLISQCKEYEHEQKLNQTSRAFDSSWDFSFDILFREAKIEVLNEKTKVNIWTSTWIERLFQFMSKLCYCHESTVDYVDLLQEYSLKAQRLVCELKRYSYISCM